MHIAYVCADPGVPVFGQKGCSVHVQEVLRALLRRGERITLLCARRGGEPPEDLRSLTILPLPRLPAQEVDDFQDSVRSLAICSEAHLRSLQDLDLIYERHSLWSDRAMQLGQELGIATCLEVNAPLIQEQQRYRQLLHPELAQRCVQQAYAAADTIIAVSNQVAASIQRDGPAATAIHVVHNGVNLQRFEACQPSAVPRHSAGLTIGFCGSLRPWHGVVDLIDAFAEHHRCHPANRLLIIGDGPERDAVLARIQQHGLTAYVRLSGAVPHTSIPDWLAQLDIGVAPYPPLADLYFSPLKLFEYMAAGLCSVAPRLGDIPMLLQHEQTGFLYDASDRQALTAALDRLSDDLSLCRRIGAQGREQAFRQHGWDQVVDRILRLAHDRRDRSEHER